MEVRPKVSSYRENRIDKIVLDLSTARNNASIVFDDIKGKITSIVFFKIPSDAAFTIKILFKSGYVLELDNTEISEGDIIEAEIYDIYVSNPSQPNKILKLLISSII